MIQATSGVRAADAIANILPCPSQQRSSKRAQHGSIAAPKRGAPTVNLGLYSITFNNEPQIDREALLVFKQFRAEARSHGFQYFLEVIAPNMKAGIKPNDVPYFINDCICRMLAGVSLEDRPLFLKVPFFCPGALEELVAYDPSMVVGVMGGSSGTTLDAFQLLADAQQHGARAALFGRRIKNAEDPLTFIAFMRRIVNGDLRPAKLSKAITPNSSVRRFYPDARSTKILKKVISKPTTPIHRSCEEFNSIPMSLSFRPNLCCI